MMGRPRRAQPWAVCLFFDHPACCPLIGQSVPGAARDMVRAGEADHGDGPSVVRKEDVVAPRSSSSGEDPFPAELRTPARTSRRARAGPVRFHTGIALAPQALVWLGPGADLASCHRRVLWACQQERRRRPPALELGRRLGVGDGLFEFGPEFCAPSFAPVCLAPNFALGVRQLWCKCCAKSP
jgi:hypothetical protein